MEAWVLVRPASSFFGWGTWMDKLVNTVQLFGVFALISGVAPLSIAVFGSFVVDPSPIELRAFWEVVYRGQDLYVYQQMLPPRYDQLGRELRNA